MQWYQDGRKVLAASIVFAVIVGAWMFRYETVTPMMIKNRFTGATCLPIENCW